MKISKVIIILLLFSVYNTVGSICENCFTGEINQTFLNVNSTQTSTFTQSITNANSLTVTITDNSTLSDMYNVNLSNISGWWKMDETTGTLVEDFSGLNNNGTWGNSSSYVTTIPGKFDNGLQFNGTGNYIDFGNTTNTNVIDGDFTIEAWVRPNATSGLQAIAGKLQFGTNSWGLYQNSNKFYMQYRGSGVDAAPVSDYNYKVGVWYHVVGTRTSTTNRLYVNGILQSSQPTSVQTPSTSNFNFTIGERTNNTHDYFFNGAIDNVRLYTRALNSSEIVQHYYQNLEELQVTATGNGTLSPMWFNNTDNPLNVPIFNAETIASLTYSLPSTQVLNNTTVYDYRNTTQWNLTSSTSLRGNTTVYNETTEGTYYHYNGSVLVTQNTTSGSINITVVNETFLNAAYKDTPSIIVNSSNFTLYFSNPFLNISTGMLNTSNAINFNISILFNNTPPNISFVLPTLDNNSANSTGTVIVNTTIFSGYGSSAFVNWNGSLIGWFRFNEGTGNSALDSTANANNAAFVNMSQNLDDCNDNVCEGWNSSGHMGKAISFNTTNKSYLNIGTDVTAPEYNITSDFTIEAWIRSINDSSASIGISQGIYGKGYDYNTKKGISLLVKSYTKWNTNKIILLVGNGSNWGEIYSNTSYVPGSWFHVAAVRNGSILRIYKNGVIDTSTGNIGGNILYGSYGASIGRPGWDSGYFNGTLDEVRIWNRSLTPNEILASYNSTLGYYNTFGNLSNGTLTYQGFVQSSDGFTNNTEVRYLTISRTPPNIISWGNNKTNNNSATVTTKIFTPINFNVTADQNMDIFAWFFGTQNIGSTADSHTYYFNRRLTSAPFSVQVTNVNGTVSKQWNVNVKQVPEIRTVIQ